jgi:hypothetical protein
MKITRSRLKEIITEEVAGIVEKKTEKERRELNTKRKQKERKMDDLRWGGTEIRQLASGIVGEDNYYRDENGYFTSAKDATSYSSYFVDGVRKSLKKATKNKDDSGRGRHKKGQGKYRLKDGSKKWEDNSREPVEFVMTLDDLSDVVESCVREFISTVGEGLDDVDVLQNEAPDKVDAVCRKRGYRTYQEILRAMNNLSLAGSGELGKSGN